MEGPARDELGVLLEAAARGDARAWRLLVEAYSGRIFGLVRAQCGDADLAEEITQSTFCTVVAKLADYAEVGRFEAWIFRIAMNRLRDEMRRRRRHAVTTSFEALEALPLEDPTAAATGGGDAAIDPAEFGRLSEAMGQLSEADRRIVHLRHVGGLSFKQIADLLGEPIGTALARHHRALRKIKAILEGEV